MTWSDWIASTCNVDTFGEAVLYENNGYVSRTGETYRMKYVKETVYPDGSIQASAGEVRITHAIKTGVTYRI